MKMVPEEATEAMIVRAYTAPMPRDFVNYDNFKEWFGRMYAAMLSVAAAPAVGELAGLIERLRDNAKIYRVEWSNTNLLPDLLTQAADALAALSALSQSRAEEAKYLIWSNEHGCFWAADRRGYRTNPAEAGRYTLTEAISICRTRSWDGGRPPETILPIESLPPPPGVSMTE